MLPRHLSFPPPSKRAPVTITLFRAARILRKHHRLLAHVAPVPEPVPIAVQPPGKPVPRVQPSCFPRDETPVIYPSPAAAATALEVFHFAAEYSTENSHTHP